MLVYCISKHQRGKKVDVEDQDVHSCCGVKAKLAQSVDRILQRQRGDAAGQLAHQDGVVVTSLTEVVDVGLDVVVRVGRGRGESKGP